jgi:hypothetical protein
MAESFMFKVGDVRSDGMVFRGYRKGANGQLEHWVSPEAWERRRAYARAHDKKRREEKRSTPEGRAAVNAYAAAYQRKARRKRPTVHMLARVKRRAKERGLAFDLTAECIIIPAVCPVLGIPLTIGKGSASDNSPELDRIDNRKGYVKGNVIVVSRRANRIKNDATVAELEKIASFYRALKPEK